MARSMAGLTAIMARMWIHGGCRSVPIWGPRRARRTQRTHALSRTSARASYSGVAFIGENVSWDRTELNVYKVVFVPFANGKPSGTTQDILTGFVEGDTAHGRPVGLAIDKSGALLVADDVGGAVWRVTSASK